MGTLKITTFNPQIITRNLDETVHLFEALGFACRHTKEDIGEMNATGIRMKDTNGFNLDISQSDRLPFESLAAIRMNVDNFEEAYQLLLDRGFKNFYGDHTVETPTSRSAVMIAPSGFVINLVQHIQK